MRTIIDTDVAVYLRDGDRTVAERVAALPAQPWISILTRVELESGIYRNRSDAPALRARVDLLLSQFMQIPFTDAEAQAYGRIVAQLGYSRRQIVDRMIAATAIVAGATLITINGEDFRGIDGLTLEVWPSPAG